MKNPWLRKRKIKDVTEMSFLLREILGVEYIVQAYYDAPYASHIIIEKSGSLAMFDKKWCLWNDSGNFHYYEGSTVFDSGIVEWNTDQVHNVAFLVQSFGI